MKNIKENLLLFISIIFIFSCNTEAKFGFRKKVKVENHTTAKTIATPHVTKAEIKVDNVDTCEMIIASIDDEKIILPKIEQHHFTISPSLSIKKIFTDTTNQKKKSAEPLPEKKENNFAMTSLAFGIVGFFTLSFGVLLPILCSLTALILGFIGLIQINSNPEKYEGTGYAVAGITLGILCLLAIEFIWIMSGGGP